MKKMMTLLVGAVFALGAFASSGLPAGYTAVDYIVAPKGAYIDTGYEPNQNTRVVMDVTVQGALEYWFGCWTNDYNRGAFALGNDGEYGIYYAIGDDGGSFKKVEGGQDGRVPDGRQTVEVTPWEFKVNAVTWTEKVESSRKDFHLDEPLYLFAQNRKGKAFVNAAQGDIICYGCSIYDNEELVREFVPCVRTSDGAVGLYDTVEQEFYENDGTGTFTASATILPAGYTAVEWIESTRGGKQFIDTGYTANGQTKVVFDALVPGRGTGQQADDFGVLFGSRTMNNWTTKAFALQMCGGNDGRNCVRFPYNGEYRQDGNKPFSYGEQVTVTCDGQHVEWTGGNAANVTFTADPLGSSKSTLYIFADNTVENDGDKSADGYNHSVMRLYSFKITEREVVKRDFVPCVRMSDGAGGLYDLAATGVDKVFYANDGAGAFAIPPEAFCTVTIGDYPHMTAAWTSGDGSVTNAVSGTSFEVLKGMTGIKVIFTANRHFEIVEGNSVVELGVVTDNVVFGEGNDYAVPTVVCTLGEVPYLDWDDVDKKMTNATLTVEYEIVSSETKEFKDGQWYVVADTVVIENGSNIKVNGSAHLILCDGAKLTVNGGVKVEGSNILYIYGQTDGTGELVANGGDYCAGIGGQNPDPWSGWSGYGNCGTVTINGGTVTATGGNDGAGIGGGFDGAGGTVTINGGTVTATGGKWGAGIGGGYQGAGGIVTINGGRVMATGGKYGAGIGGGYEGSGGTVMIAKGKVTAKGGGETVGHGYGGSDSGEVTISGGLFGMTVPLDWLAENYWVTDNDDAETKGDYPYEVAYDSSKWQTVRFVVDDPNVTGLKVRYYGRDPFVDFSEGGVRLPVGTQIDIRVETASGYYYGGETRFVVPEEGIDCSIVATKLPELSYLDWDPTTSNHVEKTCSDYMVVDRDCTTFTNGGWYAVLGIVEISGHNIKVNGSAHLILCDNASLAVRDLGKDGGYDNAAIDVSANGSVTNSLTIYGQRNGSGMLTATGGQYGAGIGGGSSGAGGTVTINGGTVTAQGGSGGAGIGGGCKGAGGAVVVNGGAVKVIAGEEAPVFGSGKEGGDDGSVSISGGIFAMEIDDGWCEPGCCVCPNNDPETKVHYPWTVVKSATVTVGELNNMTAAWTSGAGTETNAVVGGSFEVGKGTSGVKVIFTANRNYVIDGKPVVELGVVEGDIAFGEGNDYAVPTAVCTLGEVPYLDWVDVEKKMTNARLATEYEMVTSETRTFEDGKWYVVADDVEIDDGGNITVSGSAHLILCDNASLAVKGVDKFKAAIDVSVNGSETNSLTIYGQQNGSGMLTATGGDCGAGIGGGFGGCCGAVTINGGRVTARGGMFAAGIGGGGSGYGGGDGSGGTVAIRGGAVKAVAGGGTEVPLDGIGKGSNPSGASGTVAISGGIFGMTVKDSWLVPECALLSNLDPETCSDYPWAVLPSSDTATVTIGGHLNQEATFTFGDGTVTNVISGTSFAVEKGATDIKVIFTPLPHYTLDTHDDGQMEKTVLLESVAADITFAEGSDHVAPTAICEFGDIEYLDWDDAGATQFCATVSASRYELVSDETRTLEDGHWYVVTNEIEITSGANITVSGSAHLILCDGSSLTVTNGTDSMALNGRAAIGVSASGSVTNALTIYAQSGGTGRLVAQGGQNGAGIGGSFYDNDAGMVTINGGMVTANGGINGAGIGGGGNGGAGGAVAIRGGTVTATGGVRGAGFGGGGSSGPSSTGTSSGGSGGAVTICGGAVTAFAGRESPEAIGGGFNAVANGTVAISGGVFGMTLKDSWLAPGCVFLSNSDPETHAAYPWVVTPRSAAAVAVTIGEHLNLTAVYTFGDGTVTNVISGTSFAVACGETNVMVTLTLLPHYRFPDGDAIAEGAASMTFAGNSCVVDIGTVTNDITFGEGGYPPLPRAVCEFGDIEYLDWDDAGATQFCATVSASRYELVSDETRTLEDGHWYVVTNEIKIVNGGNVTVRGAAHLILCDGSSLEVTPKVNSNRAAVDVSVGDSVTNALTIYAQSGGTGRLVANGDTLDGAGIGGGEGGECGAVTINGGRVKATGGSNAAGIGGGSMSAGGVITIRGGTVTAYGGVRAAGIGGGSRSAGGTVTICGGTVTAQGGDRGAGIGGGGCADVGSYIGGANGGAGGVVTIYGGTVTAQGGDRGAGIGGGGPGDYVYASGEDRVAGIGGAGGTVTICGGAVTAQGRDRGAGIGGGAYSYDDGLVEFDENIAGVALVDDGFMTLEEYAADHSAKSVTLPVAVVSIPQVNGLVYAVSNGTEEVTGIGLEGRNLYAAATGDTFRVYFSLVPGCTYATEPPDNPMEISVRDWFTTIEAKDMPQVSVPAVEYLDWDGKEQVKKSVTDYTFVTSEMSAFEAGKTYVVAGEVVRRRGIVVDSTPDAPTCLILCDGAKLTVTGTSESYAALRVAAGGATTNALVICGQVAGTGELVVSNLASYAAAIGGDEYGAGGIVTINGGRVTATGGYRGAGIGGGYEGAGGTVTINGGSVTATGANGGAHIGGGYVGAGGTLTLGPRVLKVDDRHYREGVTADFEIPAGLQLVSVRSGDDGPAKKTEDGANCTAAVLSGQRLILTFETVDFEHRLAGNAEVSFGPLVEDVVIDASQLPKAAEAEKQSADYVQSDGETATANDVLPLHTASATMPMGQGGWYVVTGEVTTATIEVRGVANLILADGATLTVNGGIGVDKGATLNIYGQEAETGELIANGADNCAGIGGRNPDGLDGRGTCGTVAIYGGTVTATGGKNAAGIGGGWKGADGTVTLGSRIYVVEGAVGKDSDHVKIVGLPLVTVTIGEYANMTAAWTSGDGSVTNAIGGTAFKVQMWTENVKVIFTLEYNYQFVDAHETGVRELASPIEADCTVTPPAVEGIPGTVVNPWSVGEAVTAYVSDEKTLVIEGTGAMEDFASVEDVPWNGGESEVTKVTIEEGVTQIGKNALSALADSVRVNGTPLSTYRTVSTVETAINGMPLADFNAAVRYLNVGEEWQTGPASIEPVIPDNMVLVTKESIAAAKAMTVKIVGGQVELGVSVYSNADITAEAPWAPVKFTPETRISLTADGTKIILPIPVAAQQGFMILQTGDAKVSADGNLAPITVK